MFFHEFDNSEDVRNIVLHDLHNAGIKHRYKKEVQKRREKYIVKRLFKTPLQYLPTTTVVLAGGSQIQVPQFVYEACTILSENAHTEGLFRKAGSNVRQKDIRRSLDNMEKLGKKHHAIDVANILKLFFRELPEPLIPYTFHDTFLHCLRLGNNRLNAALLTCLLLPIPHLYMVMYVMEFLRTVASHSDTNKMDIHNLAIILTPSVMPLASHAKLASHSNQRLAHHVKLVQLLIENAGIIGIVPASVIEKLTISRAQSQSELQHGDDDRKKKKKRRSGSLTRMFNGLKKIVSGKSLVDEEMGEMSVDGADIQIPYLTKSASKRKSHEMSAFSNKKKREVLQLLPQSSALVNPPCTPTHVIFDQTPIQMPPKTQDNPRGSYLTLSHRRSKVKRASLGETDVPNSAFSRLERRWSVVANVAGWGRKKRTAVQTEEPSYREQLPSDDDEDKMFTLNSNTPAITSPDGVTTPDFTENCEMDFVRIPKSEYEEIKNRVSAIENRISQEFNNMPVDSETVVCGVSDVQSKYEQTLEEAGTLHCTSADQLAKRLSRELKIRRSDPQKVIRSPSARKIGTIRRRSRELDRKLNARVHRNLSWHITNGGDSSQSKIAQNCSRTTIKRGRPNTILSGLPNPSPIISDTQSQVQETDKLVKHRKCTSSGIEMTPNIQRASFHGQTERDNLEHLMYVNPHAQQGDSPFIEQKTPNIESWTNAPDFFISSKTNTPQNVFAARASLAKLRSQNAGMVLAKAKLFDELLDSSNNSSTNSASNPEYLKKKISTPTKTYIGHRSRRQSNRFAQVKQKTSPLRILTTTPRRKSAPKSPNMVQRKLKLKLTAHQTHEGGNQLIANAHIRINKENSKNGSDLCQPRNISVSPLKESNRLYKASPVLNTPKNTPLIKKALTTKSPKYYTRTPQFGSERKGRTPLKAVHCVQSSVQYQNTQHTPRLQSRHLSSAC